MSRQIIAVTFTDGAQGIKLSDELYLVLTKPHDAGLDFSLRRAWLGEVKIAFEREDEYAHMQTHLMGIGQLVRDGRKWRKLQKLLNDKDR